MATKTCFDIFAEAQTERAKYPLPYGAYKLREVQEALSGFDGTIAKIQHYEHSWIPYPQYQRLGLCMTEDRGLWLREVPEYIAWLMGFKGIPGIHALAGDGVPASAVEGYARKADRDVTDWLMKCEAVRQKLKASVHHEYTAMRHGQSLLLPIVDEAENIIMPAIAMAKLLGVRV